MLGVEEEAVALLCVLPAAGGCSLGFELADAVFDCEAIALELGDPVVLDAWLLGLLLVALVSPLLGFVASGIAEAVLGAL